LILPPGGILGLFLLAGLVRRRRRALSNFFVIIAVGGFWLFSTPWVSTQLRSGLEDIPVVTSEDPRLLSAQAIVVLGGGRRYAPEYGGMSVSGSTLERIRFAAYLQRATGLPLAVTGGAVFGPGPTEGELMARTLREEFHVPVRWIEKRSRNTVENGRYTRDLLKADHIERIVLVSHVSHMHRATDIFAATGFKVLSAPTVYKIDPAHKLQLMDWIPSVGAFASSGLALHEYLGRLWAWLTRLI